MSRIVTRTDAVRVVGSGNADLRIFSIMPAEGDSGKFYTVLLPLTTMRDGIFGPLNSAGGGNGRPTKFGSALFDALLRIEGVEPSLDREFRDGVTIFVDSNVKEEPPEGFRHQSRGLPATVCYTIQEEVMRHRTRGRHLLEYVRHLGDPSFGPAHSSHDTLPLAARF